MALLQRNVQKIVAFISASESFLTYLDNPKKQAQSGTKDMLDPDSISLDIRQLFGKGNDSWFGKEWDFQVFDGNKFNSLVEGFQEKLNAGETVMYRDTYTVQPNSFFGLKGGNEVEVLWVYNNQVANWENSLNNEVKSLIEFPFPNYHTFFPPDGGSKKLVAEFFDTAEIGASFFILFKMNHYIVNNKYNPKYESYYWIRLHLGLIRTSMKLIL
ncbi:MAG: hypothetical protein ACNYWM_02400 [Methanosarcinales archaeon]